MSTPELQEFATPSQDPALEQLVAIVNEANGSMGVTLHASGTIICGNLVSASAFFEKISELLRGANEGASAMAPWSDFWADATRYSEDEDEEESAHSIPAHIHLVDAESFTPGLGNSVPHQVWRGRLAEITGWSIGTLSIS